MAKVKSKIKKEYLCSNCGYKSNIWSGKCPECGQWNTLEENLVAVASPASSSYTTLELNEKVELIELAQLYTTVSTHQSLLFNSTILSDFFGNGLVRGSITLLAGEPGLGKSTLALQLLRSLYLSNTSLEYWYISGEESNAQFSLRAKRLSIPHSIKTLQTTNWIIIQQWLSENKPDVIIIDSIQTIHDPSLGSTAGSVGQVSSIASSLLYVCKSLSITCIIIGHVTKDGSIAGPKTLEHLVDSVLNLEKSNQLGISTLSFSKHRFGSTQQLLLLKMEGDGLQIITNPSLALLENLENGVGVCYGMTLERNLPLVIEVQSLVTKPKQSDTYTNGRREAQGLKLTKLNIIIAIAEKYLNIDLKGSDIYVQLSGLSGSSDDPNLDFAILLSIISSYSSLSVNDLITTSNDTSKKETKKPIFFARLTLSGTIRKSTNNKELQASAKKLGFEPNPSIEFGSIQSLKILTKKRRYV